MAVLVFSGCFYLYFIGARTRAIKMFLVEKFSGKNGRGARPCKAANVQ